MTAQVSDVLYIEGHRRPLICEPLLGWLLRKKNRPLRLKRRTTACSRGYVAEWAIFNGRLFLTHVHGQWRDGSVVVANELFIHYSSQYFESVGARSPDNAGPGHFAFWVDGRLACSVGTLLCYSHAGYESVYEKTLELHVRQGFLVGQRLIDNELTDLDFDIEVDIDEAPQQPEITR